MKRSETFYPENELVAKHQNHEIGWVDYIRYHSEEWCDEYEEFCKQNNLEEENEYNAAAFVAYKDENLEEALANGEA